MKLGYTIIRRKQKYSPDSGLQRGNRIQKKQKLVFFSAEKVMATVFWDSHEVFLIDYLQKRKLMTGTYYASFLDKLTAELAGEKATFVEKENPVSPRQRTVSHLIGCHGENPRITI
ncbi:hypothetical protein TNCV_3408921 [Trichonephila clavipes]|nr:hypothetical protein TNCV_3408921 [Trichonephila clavipes]